MPSEKTIELVRTLIVLAIIVVVGTVLFFVINRIPGDTEQKMKKLIEDNNKKIVDTLRQDEEYQNQLREIEMEIGELKKTHMGLKQTADNLKKKLVININAINELKTIVQKNTKLIREPLKKEEFQQNVDEFQKVAGKVKIFDSLTIEKITRKGVGIHEGQLRLTNNLFNLTELQKKGILTQTEMLGNFRYQISTLKDIVSKEDKALGILKDTSKSLRETLEGTRTAFGTLESQVKKLRRNWFLKKTLPTALITVIAVLLVK